MPQARHLTYETPAKNNWGKLSPGGKLSPIHSIALSMTEAAPPTAQSGHLTHEISGSRTP